MSKAEYLEHAATHMRWVIRFAGNLQDAKDACANALHWIEQAQAVEGKTISSIGEVG